MMSSKQKGNAKVGFLGLLTILFVGLKLAGIISWNWALVLLPVLLGLIPLLVVLIALFSDYRRIMKRIK